MGLQNGKSRPTLDSEGRRGEGEQKRRRRCKHQGGPAARDPPAPNGPIPARKCYMAWLGLAWLALAWQQHTNPLHLLCEFVIFFDDSMRCGKASIGLIADGAWRFISCSGETTERQVALRLPDSLHHYVKHLAQSNTSLSVAACPPGRFSIAKAAFRSPRCARARK